MSGEKFRCHPSIIVEKSFGVLTVLFFIVMPNLDDAIIMIEEGVTKESLIIFMGIIGLLVLILIYNVIVWSKTFINIEENTIIIQRNTINSKVNTYGIENISNVNLEQNIFERIIGTYKIKIDTDSLSTANTTDIEIVLSKKDAYDFKNKILVIMNNEKNNGVEASNLEEEKIEYDIIYSINDLLKHCFYNITLLGFIFNIGMVAFTAYISLKVDGIEGVIALGIMIVTSCISILKYFIGDFFKYYNFSIKRDEDKLYISCGLFKIKKFTVPVNKINAINIKQSFISRVLKRYQSDIVTIGVGDEQNEGSQILLSSNKEDFIINMRKIFPEINIDEYLNLERESKNHHIIKIVDAIMGMIVYNLILYVVYKLSNIPMIVFIAIDILIFLLIALIEYLSYITKGFYMGKDSLSVSWGIFSKKISIIRYEKIQYIDIRETPISGMLNLCRGSFFILANLGNSMRHLGYYDRDLYEKLKNKLLQISNNS